MTLPIDTRARVWDAGDGDDVASERAQLYRRAVEAWGAEAQMRILQEKCGELIAAINRSHRGRCTRESVAEELADVLICCAQIRLLVGSEEVEIALAGKLERLAKRLDEYELQRAHEVHGDVACGERL
jgi:NTP pyrophosphatase (non-canonical NTP hydrolase)